MGGGDGGDSVAAAAAEGGAAESDEIENPRPVCLDNEDDADVDGNRSDICSADNFYFGACEAGGLVDRSPNCPTCRAPFVLDAERFKLVHDTLLGRHAPAAQNNLGGMPGMHTESVGVEQNYVEAAKWYMYRSKGGRRQRQGLHWHLTLVSCTPQEKASSKTPTKQ